MESCVTSGLEVTDHFRDVTKMIDLEKATITQTGGRKMHKIDRTAVYKKYGGHCAYCGRKIENKDMHVDHLIPQRNGGTDDIDNLMPSCRICNHYKRAESLETFRTWISTIPVKLGEREYIYKVGMAYGFYDSEPKEVKFFFEQE